MLHNLKYPLKSVRGKIILSLLIFILIPITIIIYNVYASSQDVVRREVYQREQESVKLAADHIDAAAARMLNASHVQRHKTTQIKLPKKSMYIDLIKRTYVMSI
ncbi:hypothetical protein ACFQI7_17610 [Paenibacillus allorhizosphaerae]|uniref:Uncharacterized protein n=1 Tax=Paenibacillus allorhizosphaerae TaxID=2849866 RepID=A0ABM8VEN9_9BACL|nr:hypothetical protein [Paenibacillus allorhizosphaerae]CAG7631985.1 hypothetical protein PAECIP111802_01801 [Paenibacillus allorhizosphaerae]